MLSRTSEVSVLSDDRCTLAVSTTPPTAPLSAEKSKYLSRQNASKNQGRCGNPYARYY